MSEARLRAWRTATALVEQGHDPIDALVDALEQREQLEQALIRQAAQLADAHARLVTIRQTIGAVA